MALSLLVVSTVALLGGALWPVAGRPVLLALPPGADAAQAFADPDWRVMRLSRLGPLPLVLAAPARAEAEPLRYGREAGALLVTLAGPWAPCSPP